MIRILIIILTLSRSTCCMSQNMIFDNTVRQLYFGVEIHRSSSEILDSFKQIEHLEYSDNGVRQWNLNISLIMGNESDSWSSRHEFSFSKSPVSGLKIRSGKIIVTLGETNKLQKVIGIDWLVEFEKKSDAKVFYDRLINMFTPISTMQKEEYDKRVGHIAQFSTRSESEKGVRDVSFSFSKSLKTKKYEVRSSLMNEFVLQ